ncbi:MAG: hypothetical protein IJS81_08490, partial [Selenomonadaceae bacterium]|nr:hypothetical protein [Selenomonadaceae bacterium]
IHDNLQSLFKLFEPNLQFKGVQLYSAQNPKKFSTPLYWLPYLPITDAISEKSKIILGKPAQLVLNSKFLEKKRIAHCKLPAADIWLLSLEAAECLLRRQPIGIILEKVSIE